MSAAARAVLAGVLYFAMVFGAGAVLGTLRVLWVAPAVGARAAELAEIPVMLAIAVLAARWIVRRMALGTGERLGMGLAGFALMLACEFTVVLAARGLTLERYFMAFDPVSGTAYFAALVAFMVIPLWFEPRERAPA
jgi:hypothetical protein